jgi:hypothetical protein
VYTDVDVPDFTKRGLHLAGTFVDAGPSRLKAAPPDLLKEDVPILPTAQRDFVGGTRLVAFVRLVQGARDSLHPVTIASRVTDGAGKVIRSGSETIASSAFGRGRAADYRVGIPTSGLAPGWYLLSLEASLPGGPVQRKDVSFRVTASK